GTAICGNGSIPGKAELGQAMARPGGAHAHRGRARWQPGQRARFPGRARFMSECGEAAGSAGARKNYREWLKGHSGARLRGEVRTKIWASSKGVPHPVGDCHW
ncbi:MAG: hypothetical protein ACLQKK_10175, partial [Rhodomicrobium sp.]